MQGTRTTTRVTTMTAATTMPVVSPSVLNMSHLVTSTTNKKVVDSNMSHKQIFPTHLDSMSTKKSMNCSRKIITLASIRNHTRLSQVGMNKSSSKRTDVRFSNILLQDDVEMLTKEEEIEIEVEEFALKYSSSHSFEYFGNIWHKNHTKKRSRPFVDISQVAHVITTYIETKHEYQSDKTNKDINIWTIQLPEDRKKKKEAFIPPVQGLPSIPVHQDQVQDQVQVQEQKQQQQQQQQQQQRKVLRPCVVAEKEKRQHLYDKSTLPLVMAAKKRQMMLRHSLHALVTDTSDSKKEALRLQPQIPPGPLPQAPVVFYCQQEKKQFLRQSHQRHSLHTLPTVASTIEEETNTCTMRTSTIDGNGHITSQLFSQVFLKKKSEFNWNVKFLLGIHEPIRHSMYILSQFLFVYAHYNDQLIMIMIERCKKKKSNNKKMTKNIKMLEHDLMNDFFIWFKTFFVEYLKSQHEIKSKILLPLVQIKYSIKQDIQHAYDQIYQMVDIVLSQEKNILTTTSASVSTSTSTSTSTCNWWKRSINNDDHSSSVKDEKKFDIDPMKKSTRVILTQEFHRLYEKLNFVLDLEEKAFHIALTNAFTQKTFQQYILPRLFRQIKSKRMIVPWIIETSLEWGGKKEKHIFKNMLPFSAKFLYDKIWKPYFISHIATPIKNFYQDTIICIQQQQEQTLLPILVIPSLSLPLQEEKHFLPEQQTTTTTEDSNCSIQ